MAPNIDKVPAICIGWGCMSRTDTTRSLWLQDHILPKQMEPRLSFQSPAWETRSSGAQHWKNRTHASGRSLWTHLPMLPLASTLCFYMPPSPTVSWATSPFSLIPGAKVCGQKQKGRLGSVTSWKQLLSSGTLPSWNWRLTHLVLPATPALLLTAP